MAILKTDKAMIKALCGIKFIDKRSKKELSLLDMKDALDGLARASRVRWYGHVLRRYNNQILLRALDFEVIVKKGRGVPNIMWKTYVEEHNDKIRLKKEDVIDRTKWRNGVYELSRNVS